MKRVVVQSAVSGSCRVERAFEYEGCRAVRFQVSLAFAGGGRLVVSYEGDVQGWFAWAERSRDRPFPIDAIELANLFIPMQAISRDQVYEFVAVFDRWVAEAVPVWTN